MDLRAKIGVVGLGNIGSACVTGLLRKGFGNVYVNDVNPEAHKSLPPGTTFVHSVQELAPLVEVLITALPKPPHVRAVMEQGGVLQSLRKGSIWIDHTSTSPDESRRFAVLCEERGVRMLEAPLTGGLELLKQGIMTVLVGDNEEGKLLHEVDPILDCYTSTRLLLGRIGAAAVVKIVSNQLAALHTVGSAEALSIAVKAGVDPVAFFDGIRASAGNSYVFETEVPLMFNQTYDPGFTLDLHLKDLGIGRALCERHSVDLNHSVLELARKNYVQAMERFGPQAGSSHPGKLIEQRNKTNFFVPGWENWSYSAKVPDDGRSGTGLAVKHSLRAKL